MDKFFPDSKSICGFFMLPLFEQESTPFGQEILNDPEFFNQVQDSVGPWEDVVFAKLFSRSIISR